MKPLAQNVKLTLFQRIYSCDIIVGLYADTKRPAILLLESRPPSFPENRNWRGDTIAIATSNAPAEYIQHLSRDHFTMSSHAGGLWEQLLPLTDTTGAPLFHTTPHAITLNSTRAPIGLLGPLASAYLAELFNELKEKSNG